MNADKKTRRFLLTIVVAIVLVQAVGCSSNRATYFRKHGNTIDQEREAWGLCGGNFFKDGTLKPLNDERILSCMEKKGYKTINAYYEETFVSWTRAKSGKEIFFNRDDVLACGARLLPKGLCKETPFILSSELNSVNRCMEKKGYALSIPRYKLGIRIYDNLAKIERNFCLYYTPVNKKGGVSLGNWRME